MSSQKEIFNPLDPHTIRDPYPVYRQLRETDPVHWHEQLGAWILTRHADCLEALKNSAVFAADFRKVGIPTPGPLLSLQTLDPPDQTPLRHFAVDALRSQDLGALERNAVERAERLLDDLAGRDSIDFVSDYATPFTLGTISDLVGMPPPEKDEQWRQRNDELHRSMDAGLDPNSEEAGLTARQHFSDFVARWLATGPTEGISGYVAANSSKVDYPPNVLYNSLRAFWHAGFEVPARFLGNALTTLLANPDALEQMWSDVDTGVEELVRFSGPVHVVSRVCTEDTTLGGARLRKGDMVVIVLAAANRDPARFDRPEELVMNRAPNPHLGFGRGTHSCLGNIIARIEGRVALTAVLKRYPDLRVNGETHFWENATLRGHSSIPLSLAGAVPVAS
ncbi:cytochrome P450 [Polymorphospora rubra]|uniref:Cytochrome P450 hydroxylase n=1 Tax=Polymorphospora rubra TaxID=338584 RepID=A0A810MZT9_9ACTN|nr:cytochrome P450 [Polymorphospora rubra]BCJ66652.1 cytochrome P450 hydroxylase [Polymorphospora rubra]